MHLKKLLPILCLLLAFLACEDQPTETDNIFKFREYISYTTSGLVSVAEPIQVNLANNIEGWEAGQEIEASVLKIAPQVDGVLKADNNHTLVFMPNEDLKPDTQYTVTVALNELYNDIPKDFEDYTFQFKTIKPSFTINTYDLQSYSKEWQYLQGVLKSADVITVAQAKQLITASQKEKELNIKWLESSDKARAFEFTIDSIQRFVEDSNIKVTWDGEAIDAENEGENTKVIPGKNNFTIIKADVTQSPEQYLSLNFSDPIKKQQNFDGLITLQNVKNPKFIVDRNVLRVYPNTKLTGNVQVDVFKGIKNTEGYKLKKPFSETIAFEQIKPQVRLLTSGTILPTSDNLKLNFEAINLRAVDVRVIKIFEDNVLQFLQDNELGDNNARAIKQVGRRIAKHTITLYENPNENLGKWKAYSIDLSKYFTADPGAIYRLELSFNKSYALYDCASNAFNSNNEEEEYYDDYYYEDELADTDDEDLREERYWDNLSYSYKRYTYNWRERENPCHDAYYNREREVSQNLLGSNIGVVAKKGASKDYFFAVNNIIDTKPIVGAKVSVYNYQQQKLKSGSTSNDGTLRINLDKHASFAIIEKDNQKTYVKLDDGNSLSLSKFDVSGKKLQRGLKGYIYGERGVWRPGDSLFLTFMLNDNANKLPGRHPVKMEIKDPTGKLVYKKVTVDNINNVFSFKVPTASNYKTGTYNAKVSVGGANFYESLKIETVKPNRLKIKIDFEDDILSYNKTTKADLQVNWLHGAPAKNIKAEVKAKISSVNTAFKNYKQYVFNDPTKTFYTEETNVFEGNLDDNGFANFTNNLSVKKNAPGMLNVQYLVRAFENGGDFSLDAFTKKYAPYKSFVGVNTPEPNNYGAYSTGDNHTFSVATVDANGKPVQRQNLEVSVYKINWRWWWNSSYDDLSSYVSSQYYQSSKSVKVNTNPKGKGSFKLNIEDHNRGRYLIRITDPVSGHSTGVIKYFYKNWYGGNSVDKEAAQMLVFSTDKEAYQVGETAKLSFPSGHEGRALISIENGSEVLQHQWVKTQKGETKVEIPITKEMAPNVFLNISLLQPHAITSNDLPIRMYGVIPIMVEDPNTKLEPQIKMPNEIKPETDYVIKVSEKNKKSMTYTIAVVEEGLLDLTRFKTPNAWDSFYAREALGVKTWDIYNEVIGAYAGRIDQVFAIGGGADAAAAKNKKANRFKPVVTYLGPFLLDKGKTATHKLKMPNYIGSVRAMVVAGDNFSEAYGNAEKAVPVKKPLMVLATLPAKLSPGEQVKLPVTVFAMDKKMKQVKLKLKLSNGIKTLDGKTTKTVRFTKPDEKMVYFDLDVSQAKGINTVEVLATGHGETSTYKVEIDVENPNPFTTKVIDKDLNAKAEETITFDTFGEAGTNKATVEFSTLPPMDFTRRLDYLIQYPHGCVEQTTSSVFPQLFLADIFDLKYAKKQQIESNIKNGIKRLSQFQNASGGLGYWMGESSSNDWGTSYAGHFMIEAEKKGYVLPLTFKSNWLTYQKEAARNWRPSYSRYNSDLAQAYRLYTLALAGSPDLAAMNRLKEFTELSNEAKWRLAAAYALAGQKEASQSVSKTANINFESNRYDYYTYGHVDRNRAMALETMVITKNAKQKELAKYIANQLSSDRWMSTQTTAYCLLAMAKMVNVNGGKSLKLNYAINGTMETVNSKNAIAQREIKIKDGANSIKIINEKDNLVYVRILNTGKLKLGNELAEQRGLSVSVNYKDLNGNTIDVSKLMQGQDFVATVNVKNTTFESVNDVALSQIFPSGWSIVNTRFTDFGDTTVSPARYTDIRDDRVNFYFDLAKNGKNGSSKIFTVMLNASYLGSYYLPGTQCEAMYDNDDYLVRTKGKWIEVAK